MDQKTDLANALNTEVLQAQKQRDHLYHQVKELSETVEINKKKLEISDYEIQTRDAKIQSLEEENKLNKIEIQNYSSSIKLFEDKI